ncbi:MAG: hypothetical protein ACKOZM_08030 [Flavobacteriales bacterium]
MKPSSELFELIKTLTKSEKRFFKLQSSLQSGDKNYVRLFDVIDGMDAYDEDVVKKTFKGEKFINHLPSEKNHLYKLILKSLRGYYSETSVASGLKQDIKNIEILYNKGLFGECIKFIERAKKIATRHEKFYYLFELISWEKTLLEESYENGDFGDLDGLIREEQDVLDKLQNLTSYHVLYSKVNFVFRSGGYSRTEENNGIICEIGEHPLIKGKNTALSQRAASICYYTQGFCHVANGEHRIALEKYLRVKQILDDQPHLRTDLAKRYIRTISQIIQCYLEQREFDSAEKYIAELSGLSELEGFDTPDTISRVRNEQALCNLKKYISTARFSEGVAAMSLEADVLLNAESESSKEMALRMYYYMAYLHFGAGQLSKSLFWLNKVINDNENDLRQDLYGYARLFNIVVHYELGNMDLLEYTIKSTLRYLQKRMRDFEVEILILDQFKKLIRMRSTSEKILHLEQFKEKLDSLSNHDGSSVLKRYFDFGAWIGSKLESVSLERTLRKV